MFLRHSLIWSAFSSSSPPSGVTPRGQGYPYFLLHLLERL
eukprot:COSAG02_NODE_37206_length_445_cov_0.583815_2_plen_39_part_01